MEILLPPRQLLLPRFEFPTWLKFPRGFMASGRMKKGAGGGASNVLASVPWVAQWKFNNNGNDSIGANNLTNTNSATFTTGLLGGATGATRVVKASSQSWSIGDNAALSMGDLDFTIAMWVKFNSFDGTIATIAQKGDVFLNIPEWAFTYNASPTPDLSFTVSDGGINYLALTTTSGHAATGVWYCVIGWHDAVSNIIGLYVNGASDSTAYSFGSCDSTRATQIGGDQLRGARYVNADFDNVCIAKSAAGAGGVLSAAQRTAFYNAGVGTETLS